MTASDDNELARMYLEKEIYRKRYEVLRVMTPMAFTQLWEKNLHRNQHGGKTFDSLVDELVQYMDERKPAEEPDYEDRSSNEMMEHYKRGGR